QSQQRGPAGIRAARGEYLRTGEEISLEQVEAEPAGFIEILVRLDLFRDQRLAVALDRGGELRKMRAIGGEKIHLDVIHVGQRLEQRFVQRDDVIEGEHETRRAQLGAALEQR